MSHVKRSSLGDEMCVCLGWLVVSLPSSALGEQDVGPWVPFVQKADFGMKCLCGGDQCCPGSCLGTSELFWCWTCKLQPALAAPLLVEEKLRHGAVKEPVSKPIPFGRHIEAALLSH